MSAENVAYCMDCMEHMKSLPDDYYDLVIADPPYGAGFTEGGGCKGWFTKYHQEGQTQPSEPIDRHNLRGGLSGTRVSRTGGTWAEKYGKKS